MRVFDARLRDLAAAGLSDGLVTQVLGLPGAVLALQATEAETGVLTVFSVGKSLEKRQELRFSEPAFGMCLAPAPGVCVALGLQSTVVLFEFSEGELRERNRASFDVLLTDLVPDPKNEALIALDLVRGLVLMPLGPRLQFGAPQYFELTAATAVAVNSRGEYIVATGEGKLVVVVKTRL